MQRLIISMFCLSLMVSGVIAQETARPPEQDKIIRLETLWSQGGVPKIIHNWAHDSAGRHEVAEQFMQRHQALIMADLRSFSRFFRDTALLDPELKNPVNFLEERKAFYHTRLSEFARTEYDPMWARLEAGSTQTEFLAPMSTNQCTNVNFELGNMSQWQGDTGVSAGLVNPVATGPYPATIGWFNYGSRIQVYNTVDYDPIVGGTALPVICPDGGSWSAKIEDFDIGYGLSALKKTFVVDAAQPWFVYKYAVVLQDPGDHGLYDRPFFEVKMTQGPTVIPCSYYKVFAEPPIENFAQVGTSTFYWRDWTTVVIPLDDYVGQTVTIQFMVGDCALGGHMAYAYLDGGCLDGTLALDASCTPEKTITAPFGFDHYHWTGEEITGDNYRHELKVKKGGDYAVHLTTVTGCSVDRTISIPGDCPQVTTTCTFSSPIYSVSGCDELSNTYSVTGQITLNSVSGGFLLVKCGPYSQIINITGAGPVNFSLAGLPADGSGQALYFYYYKSRHFSSFTQGCAYVINFTAPGSCATAVIECEDCIKGFHPQPDSTYVISVWVKENGANPLVYEYTQPFAKVTFSGTTPVTYTYTATGEIIDGWQRISAEFTVPSTSTGVTIQLGTGSGTAYFDDLRIYPANGTFKTFVYDPVTLRLVAELDENNYATFYEYDEEGSLVRIKKETERGVMTIQENRNFKVKRQ